MWRSTGKVLDDTFLMWIKENPAIIVPPFRDVVFPNVQFSQTKLVALGWDPLMFYNNVIRCLLQTTMLKPQVNHFGRLRNGALPTAKAMYGLMSQMSAMWAINGMKLHPIGSMMKRMP